ncbi:MAG: VOC family protein [Bacteroidales bacterium]|nr:VOC family protein [Bacteroidales bacterium]
MKKNVLKLALLVFITGFSLNACDSDITYPSVTEKPTGEHHQGQFVWHDLATSNPQVAMDFYATIFDWKYKTLGSGDKAYYVILLDDKPIGGIFKLAEKYADDSEWVSSISVENVDAAVEYNKTKGGMTIFKAADFKGRGRTALVQDPQGAMVAFLRAEGGDPSFIDPLQNTWLWNELWTIDMEGSVKYYEELLAYSPKSILGSKVPYTVFEKDGQKMSGVLGNPVKNARSAWMPYIRVENIIETVESAKKAGAKLMMAPNETIRQSSVAVLLDPVGAQFTIQKWPIK